LFGKRAGLTETLYLFLRRVVGKKQWREKKSGGKKKSQWTAGVNEPPAMFLDSFVGFNLRREKF
jgi:hypothetical protein